MQGGDDKIDRNGGKTSERSGIGPPVTQDALARRVAKARQNAPATDAGLDAAVQRPICKNQRDAAIGVTTAGSSQQRRIDWAGEVMDQVEGDCRRL